MANGTTASHLRRHPHSSFIHNSFGTNLNEQLRLVSGIGDDRPKASAFIQGRDKLTEGLYRKVFETTTGSTEHTLFGEKHLVIACTVRM
jgi:hypothetical protein